MKKEMIEAIDSVSNINELLSEKEYTEINKVYHQVGITTNGEIILIEWLGIQIWRSDEGDDRHFSEDDNEYEPLQGFLLKQIKTIIETISKFKL